MVYDPAKLDVGPETEAILDQLKGREYQVSETKNNTKTNKSSIICLKRLVKKKKKTSNTI